MKQIENMVFQNFTQDDLETMDILQRRMIENTAKINVGGKSNERDYCTGKTV